MKRAIDARGAERLLEVRTVEVISGRGLSIAISSVRCPVRRRSSPVEECAACGNGAGLAQDALARGEYLACRVHGSAVPAGPAGEGPAVGEVMGRTATALRAGVGRAAAADALRARGLAAAPVVDGDGRPIGLVSEADLLRARTGAKVADAMRKVALSVAETAPLARAAALMAEHHAERLAVVSGDGVVVGTIAADEIVAWVAGPAGPIAAEAAAGVRRARAG